MMVVLIFAFLVVVGAAPAFFRSQPRNISETFLEGRSLKGSPLAAVDVKFRISAKDLEKKDIMGTSDPYAVVTYTGDKVSGEVPLGHTSIIQNNVNPSWGEGFRIRYDPGMNQRLHFVIWDKDAGLDDQIADVTIKLGDLVRSVGPLQYNLRPGYLIIEKQA